MVYRCLVALLSCLHYVGMFVYVPVCRGTEMCILQLVRTTALPAVSSLTTIGLSAGSFSMRSLTSYIHTHTQKKAQQIERKASKGQ